MSLFCQILGFVVLIGLSHAGSDAKKGTLKYLIEEISKINLHRDINVEYLELSEQRKLNIAYDGLHKNQLYSPEINSFIEDSSYNTEFMNYMKDLKFEFKQQQCQTEASYLDNQTIYKFNYENKEEVRLRFFLNLTFQTCSSIYKFRDFIIENDLNHDKELNFTKFSQYLINRYTLSISSIKFYLIVLPPKYHQIFKESFKNYSTFEGFHYLENSHNLPIYFDFVSVEDHLRANLATLNKKYLQVVSNVLSWNPQKQTLVNKLDHLFVEKFEKFIQNISNHITSNIQNGKEMLTTDQRLTEIFYAGFYTQLSLKLIEFQEHVFLARQWASVLSYKRAQDQLQEAQEIFDSSMIPLFKENLIAHMYDFPSFIILREIKQYTMTILFTVLFGWLSFIYYKRSPDFQIIAKKVV